MGKLRYLTGVFLLVIFFLPTALSATTHEITKWRYNRAAAASLTFDDGYVSEATTGKDLLKARNLRGTFFLITNSVYWDVGAPWEVWRSVAADGNEIAGHSVSHPYLTSLTEEQLRLELSQSQALINLNIPTQACLTFAYPYDDWNDFVKAITSEYYIAARACENPDGFSYYPGGTYRAIDLYAIGSFGLPDYTIDQMKSYLDSAGQTNAWICVYMHSLTDPAIVTKVSQYMDELLKRDIWVETFGTIVRYIRERVSSTLVVQSENTSGITLSLSHPLDPSIFNIPLTIRSTVPSTWSEVLITQGSSEYTVTPTIENGEPVVYYDAVPNAGVISLLPKNPTSPPRISKSPNALSASILVGNNAPAQTFSVWNSVGGTLSYSISSDQSWLICSPTSGTSTGEQNLITVSYATSSLTSGAYLATISISDPAASNSPQAIPVSLTVANISQASISLNPSGLSAFTMVGGNAPAQTFNIRNSGGGTLSYSISSDQSWLICSPASGTSTGEQDATTVSYATSSLASGTYSAAITVSDPGAANSPQTIPVSLTVTTVPQASLELNFEEGSGTTAYDTSPSHNNGTIYGGAVYTTDRAVGSYSLSVDGIDDYVVCQGNPSLRPNDISVSLWVKHITDTNASFGGIVQGPYGSGFYDGYRILDYKNSPLAEINFGDAQPVWILGGPFTQNEWCHLALTYDHTKIRLYQNAQLVVEIPETRDINWYSLATDPTIGWAQHYFKGMIDKVMMFGYALTPQQIQVLYNDRLELSSISLNPSTLSPSVLVGNNAPAQTFSVWNSGGGTLSYSISSDQSWLICSPASGTSTGEQNLITVSYATASLATGTYSATITINGAGASNMPQTIPVSLTVTAPVAALSAVSVSPASVLGGVSSTGTVTLDNPAPVGGAVVSLTSSNTAAAQVPASVTVAAGATMATFTATTSPVASNTSVTISALYNSITRTTTLTVTAATLTSVTRNPTSVRGGNPSTGTVTLSGQAPVGGAMVTLSSSNTAAATVPASVTVAAGATTATFTVTTSPVASNTSVRISATYRSTTQRATLTVNAPTMSSLTLSPASVQGGNSSTGTVTLNGPAPAGGIVVTLSSSRTSVATVPASVTVAAGATTATFLIATKTVTSSTSVTITAKRGTSRTATLTVTP